MRALVAESDPVSAKLVHAALRAEGLIAEPIDTGEDAIDLAKHYDFDILIIDNALPDVSGLDVISSDGVV